MILLPLELRGAIVDEYPILGTSSQRADG